MGAESRSQEGHLSQNRDVLWGKGDTGTAPLPASGSRKVLFPARGSERNPRKSWVLRGEERKGQGTTVPGTGMCTT